MNNILFYTSILYKQKKNQKFLIHNTILSVKCSDILPKTCLKQNLRMTHSLLNASPSTRLQNNIKQPIALNSRKLCNHF